MMQTREIRKVEKLKLFFLSVVIWIGLLSMITSLKTNQRSTKVIARMLMIMKRTPDFHVHCAFVVVDAVAAVKSHAVAALRSDAA